MEMMCYFYSQTVGQNLSYGPKFPVAIFDPVLSAQSSVEGPSRRCVLVVGMKSLGEGCLVAWVR